MGSLKKVVKKVAKPEVIIPLALMAATGGMSGIAGAGAAGTAGAGAASGTASTGIMSKLFGAAATGGPPNLSMAATKGLFGKGGELALSKGILGQGIKYGLANPLSKRGLATYGTGAGLLGLMMGKDKTEAQKNLNTDPQAVYDMGRLMNKQMGGAYTDEELNTYMAPLLSQYGGKYQIADKEPERKRRMMFPGLNYSGLTRYAADGGAIVGDDELSQQLYDEMQREQEIEETLFRLKMGQSMSDEPIIMGPETYNTGRANGGIMMALGGSVPQTNNIPQGMQLDGRGGGFIPMGAQEKHDDVPAMLAKNEFVMTSDAVKAAGGGSMNKGAQAMYDLMHSLESKV